MEYHDGRTSNGKKKKEEKKKEQLNALLINVHRSSTALSSLSNVTNQTFRQVEWRRESLPGGKKKEKGRTKRKRKRTRSKDPSCDEEENSLNFLN